MELDRLPSSGHNVKALSLQKYLYLNYSEPCFADYTFTNYKTATLTSSELSYRDSSTKLGKVLHTAPGNNFTAITLPNMTPTDEGHKVLKFCS